MASYDDAKTEGGDNVDWTNAFIDLGSGVAVAYHPDVKLAVDPGIDVDTHDRVPTNDTIADPVYVTSETGRTYHGYKEGKYFIPNDGVGQDRLAPFISDPEYVLDIGTGTGIWAIDFAQEHPRSNVIGTDLSLIQPSNVPSNVTFVRDDAEDPWIFLHMFDYVHARFVTTCFNGRKGVIRSAFDSLKPGGWIEYQDIQSGFWSPDNSVHGTELEKWGHQLIAGSRAMGRDIDVARKYGAWMKEIGFVDVIEIPVPLPGNEWPADPKWKTVGSFVARDLLMGLDGISRKMLQGAGMSPDEIAHFLAAVRGDIVSPMSVSVVVYGRKPHDHENAAEKEVKLEDIYVHRTDPQKILIFTDGACLNNGQPNPRAGWGFVYGPGILDRRAVVSGRLESQGPFGDESAQTSNRAEIRAVIAALRFRDWADQGYRAVVIATDSEYAAEGSTEWVKTWLRNGWKTQGKAEVKNRDLWEMLLGEVERWQEKGLTIQFWKIPRYWNGLADAAAKDAAAESHVPSRWTECSRMPEAQMNLC
ncbi:methyltransferase domain-containing protein [Seiridium cupressi]